MDGAVGRTADVGGERANLADRFEAVAAASPHLDAIVSATRHLSFGDLDRRANQVARMLRVKSVGPGDAIGVMVGDGAVRVEAMLAILKARAVPYDLGPDRPPDALAALLAAAGTVGLIVGRARASSLLDVAAELPRLNFFVVVDDGSEADVSLPNAVFYEEGRAAYDADQEWGARSAADGYGIIVLDDRGHPSTRVVPQSDLADDPTPDDRPHLDPALAILLAARTLIL